jgi:hypothetical protein
VGLGLLTIVGALVVVGVVVGAAARYSDGPIGPFPGGALRSGELFQGQEIDWTFAKDVRDVELELLDPSRSRTTWIIVHEGKAYVPCGLPEFRLWKQWPHEAERDGRAILRVKGKRYEAQAVRVIDPELHTRLAAVLARKYGLDPNEPPGPEQVWFFRMDLRSVPPTVGAQGRGS